jgi:Tfp pilus assembly protein PilF
MSLWLIRPLIVLALLLTACAPSPTSKAGQEAKSHYLLGASALAENNPTQALKEFLLAEQANSWDADIQAGLGRAYLEKGAYELSEQHYRRAISLSKGNPQYYNNLGALYLTMQRYDDALPAFQQAADNLLFATPEIAWAGIGLVRLHQQNFPAAEQAYRKALELNPRYAQAHFRLGELYYRQERFSDADKAFGRAVELEPRYVDGHYWLGLSAMKTNDTVRARQAFSETLRLAPDSEQARLARGHLKTLP